jgi:hypothetical protein
MVVPLVPAVQVAHLVEMVVPLVPAVQAVHLVEMVVPLVPAVQVAHLVEMVVPLVPAVQVAHLVEMVLPQVPVGWVVQVVIQVVVVAVYYRQRFHHSFLNLQAIAWDVLRTTSKRYNHCHTSSTRSYGPSIAVVK